MASTAPDAPYSTHPLQCGPQNLTFFWIPSDPDADPPITTYLFTITPEGGAASTYLIDAPETGFTADGLVTDISYNAIVQASTDYGSTFGPAATFDTTFVVAAPTAPPATATATRTSSTQALVEWTAPAAVPAGKARYFVAARSSDLSDPGLGFSTQDLTETSCTMEPLNPSSTYTFIVTLRNAAGYSPGITTNPVTP